MIISMSIEVDTAAIMMTNHFLSGCVTLWLNCQLLTMQWQQQSNACTRQQSANYKRESHTQIACHFIIILFFFAFSVMLETCSLVVLWLSFTDLLYRSTRQRSINQDTCDCSQLTRCKADFQVNARDSPFDLNALSASSRGEIAVSAVRSNEQDVAGKLQACADIQMLLLRYAVNRFRWTGWFVICLLSRYSGV